MKSIPYRDNVYLKSIDYFLYTNDKNKRDLDRLELCRQKRTQVMSTGACGPDFCLTPPPSLFSCVTMLIYFAYKILNLGVLISIYIKQIPEIKGFLRRKFSAHIPLKGWQLHLKKAYPYFQHLFILISKCFKCIHVPSNIES